MSDLQSDHNRSMQLRHLAEAERHILQRQRHIAEQEARIEHLASLGGDTTEARILLNNFYSCQKQHLLHRDCIRKELETNG